MIYDMINSRKKYVGAVNIGLFQTLAAIIYPRVLEILSLKFRLVLTVHFDIGKPTACIYFKLGCKDIGIR